jgi:hypothetical protein
VFPDYKGPIVTILSVNPTSVTLSIGTHEFGLPAALYVIVVSRITGVTQELCTENVDEHQLTVVGGKLLNIVSFNELEEQSAYHIDVVANHHHFNDEEVPIRVMLNFTTSGAGKRRP